MDETVSVLQEAGLMDRRSPGKALVFCNTKRMTEQVSNQLYRQGVPCNAIHGDKDQTQRDRALNALKSVDIKGVGLVLNYDMANNAEDYVHRIGRTGRVGSK